MTVQANETGTFDIAEASIGLTGTAKLTNFNGVKTIAEYLTMHNGATSVKLYEIVLTNLPSGCKLKGWRSTSAALESAEWTKVDGVLDPDGAGHAPTEADGTQETWTLLEGDNVKFFKFKVIPSEATPTDGEEVVDNSYDIIFAIK